LVGEEAVVDIYVPLRVGVSVLLYDMFKNSSLVVGMFSSFPLRLLVLLPFLGLHCIDAVQKH
jgi:hypothetical protein